MLGYYFGFFHGDLTDLWISLGAARSREPGAGNLDQSTELRAQGTELRAQKNNDALTLSFLPWRIVRRGPKQTAQFLDQEAEQVASGNNKDPQGLKPSSFWGSGGTTKSRAPSRFVAGLVEAARESRNSESRAIRPAPLAQARLRASQVFPQGVMS